MPKMQELAPEKPGLAETIVVVLMTLGALALSGAVLAYWTWAWFGPRIEPRAEAGGAPAARIEAAFGLFGNAKRDTAAARPAGTQVRLLGVAAASDGRSGHAIVQLDLKQSMVVREHEEIAPGIRLAEVHADHVVLERSGVRETLAWPRKEQRGAFPGQGK